MFELLSDLENKFLLIGLKNMNAEVQTYHYFLVRYCDVKDNKKYIGCQQRLTTNLTFNIFKPNNTSYFIKKDDKFSLKIKFIKKFGKNLFI